MNLQISLQSEITKTKRTAALYLTIFAAAFGPLISGLEMALDGISPDERINILSRIFTTRYQMTGFLVLPFFIILACTLVSQVEFRNNTWKQVLASPQSKANIFFAKFINIQLLVFLFLFVNLSFMYVNAVILHFADPSLNVLGQPINVSHVLLTLFYSYFAMLPLCAIQFWLGLRFRNFIVPIGIGIGLWFAGTILVMQSANSITAYFPYSYHAHGRLNSYTPYVNPLGWIPLVYTFLFLAVGYLDFKKRRMSS